MRVLVLAFAVAAMSASSALAQPAATTTTETTRPAPVGLPPVGEPAELKQRRVVSIALAHGKVDDWLDRYPREGRTSDATYDRAAGAWTVNVWWGEAGEIARAKVDDDTARVLEACTGPQVAWTMARGYDGAFCGHELNDPWLWLALSAVFFVGLASLRRPLSLHNLDLLVLLSFGVSLAYFNEGDIFTSVPLAYPPLVYLLARMVWIGIRGRATSVAPVWPVWVLAAATVFLLGFRIGLNTETSNVIDVGYAGVIGAHRIANGEAPYGHMPVEADRKPCGAANAEGVIRDRIQTNGRCETANENGDTYGPFSYLAYLPGYWLFGWEGRWDDLPAAHFTSIAWDLLVVLGLLLVGRRFGGARLAAALPFAWAAYPFTQYTSNANTNDAIQPALLVWGFWLVSSPAARGAFLALASWTKLSALILVPLWASYPDALRRPRAKAVFACGFALASLAAFAVLLLEPNPFEAARLFYERTFEAQIGRESPFSLWDWGQYHADGIPDLKRVQQVLMGLVAAGGIAAYFVPRRKSPLQLAALTGALVIAFELVLTHWFYLYIPWFFPFVALALLATAPGRRDAPPPEDGGPARVSEGRRTALVAGGALGLLLVTWVLLHQAFWARLTITDVPVYEGYGEAIARGEVPYRDFAVEYPPAALAAFVVPTFGEGSEGYRRVFEALMWACAAAVLLGMLVALRALGRRTAAVVAALSFTALFPLALGSVVLSRFDLLPAALTVCALAALLSGRERLGAAALGVAAAAKVFPAAVLPLALAYVWRRAGRREALVCGGVFGAVVAACIVPFALVAPAGVWDALAVHATRGLQVESLGSSLVLAAHQLAGVGVAIGSSAGSQNLVGSGADALALVQTLLQAAVVAALWVAYARGDAGDRERLVRYSAAVVCAFVALGKVLSPQFLIWLLPLVPLVRGRRGVAASGLLAVAAVLTQLWFPHRYWDLVLELDATASWLVLARNGILLALAAALVWPAPVRHVAASAKRAGRAASAAAEPAG